MCNYICCICTYYSSFYSLLNLFGYWTLKYILLLLLLPNVEYSGRLLTRTQELRTSRALDTNRVPGLYFLSELPNQFLKLNTKVPIDSDTLNWTEEWCHLQVLRSELTHSYNLSNLQWNWNDILASLLSQKGYSTAEIITTIWRL